MIGEVMSFLRDRLNASLQSGADPAGGGSSEDKVVFPEGEKLRDSVEFKLGAVTAMLVDLEEETTLRPADRYARTVKDGSPQRTSPEVRLNLNILFVCHFKQYADSLKSLSQIIQFFQSNRVFHHGNSPGLPSGVDQLNVELVTLSYAEQNEVWGALRTSTRPSVMYRIRMLVFRDPVPRGLGQVDETELRLHA